MIKIYTKHECGYCEAAKGLLMRRGIPFTEVVLDPSDKAQWEALYIATGKKSSQIFMNSKRIGGYQELVTLAKGNQLESLRNEFVPDNR